MSNTVQSLRPLILDAELDRLTSYESPKPQAQFVYTEPSQCQFIFTDASMSIKPIKKWAWTFYNNDTNAVISTSTLENPSVTINPCVNVRAELVIETEDTFNPSNPYVQLLVKAPIAVQASPSVTNAIATLNGASSYSFDSDLLIDEFRWSIEENGTDVLVLGYISKDVVLSISGALSGGTAQAPQINLKTLYDNSFTTDISTEITFTNDGLAYDFEHTSSTGITNYEWKVFDTDGTTILTTALTSTFSYTFAGSGVYVVSLKVSDGTNEAIRFHTITVA